MGGCREMSPAATAEPVVSAFAPSAAFSCADDGEIHRRFHEYQIYGVSIRCEIRLNFPSRPLSSRPDVTLFFAPPDWLAPFAAHQPAVADPSAWYLHFPCPDGSHYLRWQNLFEFVVSPDGRSVGCRKLERATIESFQTYLLGQVLSFALVKQGHEPLHSTVVVVDGKGVAFLGECGYGKSTLAAAFLHAGYPVLTDDLLMMRDLGGNCCGFPGAPRIKLFPEVAQRFLPRQAAGTPMNPDTEKLIIPLEPRQSCAVPVPLRAFYALNSTQGSSDIAFTPLTGTEAFIELIRSTFNLRLVDPNRLQRQFMNAERLLSGIPIRRLTYPRSLDKLPQVRDAIVTNVRAARRETS